MKMSVSFLISYIAVSAFFFSIDNIANMFDSSSSEESIDSIRPEDDTKHDQDSVGISIRQGKEFEPIQLCQYCKNGISHNRWHVINRVKREGTGYNVNQIVFFHAKMALSDDELQLLLILLKTSSDTEIKQLQAAWIQSMHQGMGKGAETGSTRRSSREWFKSVDIN